MTEATIAGHADPTFAPLADAFADNFTRHGEIGAALCVILEGEVVVDLWGGMADPDQGRPWREDTLVPVFSNTKLATAILAHRLIDEGLLLPDVPVTRWWPEYAAATPAKADTTLHDMLAHRAGLPAFPTPLPKGAFLDWGAMVGRLEKAAPLWAPGTDHGYHMLTFGWLVGEVLRRAGGAGLDALFRDRIAGPLGIDLHISLPESEDHRVALVLKGRIDRENPPAPFYAAVFADPDSLQGRAMLNTGRWDWNDPAYRRAEIGAAGAVGTARGLAGLVSPLAMGGGDLLSAERVAALARPVSRGPDRLLLADTAFSEGAMLAMHSPDGMRDMDFPIPPGSFGHVGMGGSFVLADPARRLATAYVMNRLGEGLLVNERGRHILVTLDRLLPPRRATG